jgi:hypothetical protein
MRKNKRKALKELRKSLPIVMGLMCNPKFFKAATKAGYKFDMKAILKAFADASGWKFSRSFLFKHKV